MGRDYFQTKDGILNLVLLVLNTVSFVCMVSSVTTGVAHFLGFTAKIPWPWSYMEIIYTEIWMLYYFIVTGFILTTGIIQYIAAGIFGLITGIAYLIKSLHIYVARIAVEATAVYVRQ
ncbi:hypothetical protein Trydic_g22712 [Trypoxylus dichotomus]